MLLVWPWSQCVSNCKIPAEVLAFLQKSSYKQSSETHVLTLVRTCWLENTVLTHLPELQKRLTGSTKEVSHKATALLQQEVRAKQEPLSVQEYQFNGRPLRNAEHHSFLVEAKETRSSGPCQNQGCDLPRHIRKVSLFSAVSSRKAGGSEICEELWGEAQLDVHWLPAEHMA